MAKRVCLTRAEANRIVDWLSDNLETVVREEWHQGHVLVAMRELVGKEINRRHVVRAMQDRGEGTKRVWDGLLLAPYGWRPPPLQDTTELEGPDEGQAVTEGAESDDAASLVEMWRRLDPNDQAVFVWTVTSMTVVAVIDRINSLVQSLGIQEDETLNWASRDPKVLHVMIKSALGPDSEFAKSPEFAGLLRPRSPEEAGGETQAVSAASAARDKAVSIVQLMRERLAARQSASCDNGQSGPASPAQQITPEPSSNGSHRHESA